MVGSQLPVLACLGCGRGGNGPPSGRLDEETGHPEADDACSMGCCGKGTSSKWKYVGDGRGDYTPVQFGFVGDKAGNFELDAADGSAEVGAETPHRYAIIGLVLVSLLAFVGAIVAGHVGASSNSASTANVVQAVEDGQTPRYSCVLPTPAALPKPDGTKDMGGWTKAVYSADQQKMMGIDESGHLIRALPAMWQEDKRIWCCENEGVGCAATPAPPSGLATPAPVSTLAVASSPTE